MENQLGFWYIGTCILLAGLFISSAIKKTKK